MSASLLATARSEVAKIYSVGVVGASGWDADGNPIGGWLTASAVSEINTIAHEYAEATGLCYEDARRAVTDVDGVLS